MTSTNTPAHAQCLGDHDARVLDWMAQFGAITFQPGEVQAMIEAAGGGHNTGGTYAGACDVLLGIANARAGYLARLTTELAAKVDRLTAECDEAHIAAARLEGQLSYLKAHSDV